MLKINHHSLIRCLLLKSCTRTIINTRANNHKGVGVHNCRAFFLFFFFCFLHSLNSLSVSLPYINYLPILQLLCKPELHFKRINQLCAFSLTHTPSAELSNFFLEDTGNWSLQLHFKNHTNSSIFIFSKHFLFCFF